MASRSPGQGGSAGRGIANSTFVNGLALLEALARAGAARGVSDLARELGLTKSNVHRLLRTLADHGYVHNPGAAGRYEITLKLWELGARALDGLDVKAVAFPFMEELAALSGETVHLSVLDQGEVVYVDKVDSPRPVRAYSRIGGRAPAYCVATGKALLAHAPEAVVAAVTKRLEPHTAGTITDPAALRAELQRIRRTGYAVNRGEWREGVGGAAAPIRDAGGQVVAAIGISGPTDRLRPRTLKRLVPAVVAAASAVSARLGWRPP